MTRAVLAVTAIVLCLPAAASAGTVASGSLAPGPTGGAAVLFGDTAGENNSLVFERDPSVPAKPLKLTDTTALTDDDGAGGCDVSGNVAHCPEFDQNGISANLANATPPVDPPETNSLEARDSLPITLAFGGPGVDTITGSDGPDQMIGFGGNDVLSGGGGDDIIDGANFFAFPSPILLPDGNDQISGGAGDDILSGGTGPDNVTGGPGHDEVVGGEGPDTLDGGADNDTLVGGTGPDTITSNDGGPDEVSCGGGNDSVTGDSSDSVTGDCETVTGAVRGGPQGPQGLPGPTGPAGPNRPFLAFTAASMRARAGRRFRVRYVANGAGPVTLTVLRGNRRVQRRTLKAKRGRNSARLRLKKAGRYKLRITTAAGGATARDQIPLRVRR
jgi:hypothetical protein